MSLNTCSISTFKALNDPDNSTVRSFIDSFAAAINHLSSVEIDSLSFKVDGCHNIEVKSRDVRDIEYDTAEALLPMGSQWCYQN
jgi:hypothetical protein